MRQNRFELVVFDWDGTLFDSVAQIVASLQWAAQQFQIELCPQAARNIIGLGLPEAMQVLFPQHTELQPHIQTAYAQHYVANTHTQQWFDGVEALLQQLSARGMLLSVATGKSRAGLDRVIQQTGSQQYFAATRCASETLSKPDPLMLRQLLQETGIAAERAVMVGDTSYDMEMAQRIDMPRIGVSYGVHDTAILNQYQPWQWSAVLTRLPSNCLPSLLKYRAGQVVGQDNAVVVIRQTLSGHHKHNELLHQLGKIRLVFTISPRPCRIR